jgi:hypothetical protein
VLAIDQISDHGRPIGVVLIDLAIRATIGPEIVEDDVNIGIKAGEDGWTTHTYTQHMGLTLSTLQSAARCCAERFNHNASLSLMSAWSPRLEEQASGLCVATTG